LFRLSLTQRANLFVDVNRSREEHLRLLFGAQHDFEHFGNPFVYVPAQPAVLPTTPFVLGQVGRPILTEENLPPEQGFALSQRQTWRAAVLALDPRSHPDGQKVAFSDDDLVGEPFAVLRAFVKHLNDVDPDSPYNVEVEPIFSPRSFWEFADANKGEITSLVFEFVTPNMFGTSDALENELRELRDDERAQKATLKLRSRDGLNPDTKRVRASVEYAGKGAGKVVATTKKRKRYDSTKQTQVVIIDDDSSEPLLVRAARRISEILGLL
jgi:hypothetical protein